MRKVFAIASTCCALALALGLAGCGGSPSSGETPSGAAARAEAEAQAAEAQAALDEGLGYWFGTGKDGYDKEMARAAFQQAADEDYYAGWHRLANLYAATGTVYGQGAGLGADPAKEFEYESKEAALGVVYPLGRCYLGGIGCDVDFAKAFELYTQEADGGRSAAWAMGGLAYLYATGSGVEKNYETAADWCNKSLAAACPGDDGIVEYANNMLAQIAENSQREAQA